MRSQLLPLLTALILLPACGKEKPGSPEHSLSDSVMGSPAAAILAEKYENLGLTCSMETIPEGFASAPARVLARTSVSILPGATEAPELKLEANEGESLRAELTIDLGTPDIVPQAEIKSGRYIYRVKNSPVLKVSFKHHYQTKFNHFQTAGLKTDNFILIQERVPTKLASFYAAGAVPELVSVSCFLGGDARPEFAGDYVGKQW